MGCEEPTVFMVLGETLGGVVEPWWFVVRKSQMLLGWKACCCFVNKEGFALLDSSHLTLNMAAYVCNPSTREMKEEFGASCDCTVTADRLGYIICCLKNLKDVKQGEREEERGEPTATMEAH